MNEQKHNQLSEPTNGRTAEQEDHPTRQNGIAGSVLLIGLGLILLLRNIGLLDWNVWEIIFRLWPILLIVAGLDMLVGRRSIWGSLLTLVLTAVIIGGAIWLFRTNLDAPAEPVQPIEQPLEEANQAQLILQPGIGTLKIGAGRDITNLAEGTVRVGPLQSLQREFSVTNDRATFSLRSEGVGVSFGPTTSSERNQSNWDLQLNPTVPLSMTLDVGVGESYLDLRDLTINQLDASMGVGQTIVVLPTEGDLDATIEGAIGRTLIYVPEELAVRIDLDTGLAGHRVPDTYHCDDDTCTSPQYETSDQHVELVLIQAIGNITVLPLTPK